MLANQGSVRVVIFVVVVVLVVVLLVVAVPAGGIGGSSSKEHLNPTVLFHFSLLAKVLKLVQNHSI
jgi:hypothetical protein